LLEDRALKLAFEGRISKKTQIQYEYQFLKFLEFSKIKTASGLLLFKNEGLQKLVEDQVYSMKQRGLTASTVNVRVSAIKRFMDRYDKLLNWTKVYQLFPPTAELSGERMWANSDIELMLSSTTSKRTKAIVMFYVSTGARLSVLTDPPLRMRHIKDMEENILAVKLYEGYRERYWAFLSNESSKYLQEHWDERKRKHEVFTSESPVFRADFKVGSAFAEPMSEASLSKVVSELVAKVRKVKGDVKRGRRYDIQRTNGFRKRVENAFINSGVDIARAELLLSHDVKLHPMVKHYYDSVDSPAPALLDEFKKAMPLIIVSDEERLRLRLKNKEQKVKELETEKDKVIAKLTAQAEETRVQVAGLWELIGKKEN